MNEKKPLVSVVMSVYNEASFVSEAISSILNQTYRNIELIIVDDASSDNTVNIIETINDVRIKLIKNEENKGLAHNLNVAIRNSTGEYIARMDGDDISHPERIREQVLYMEKNKDVDICGTFAKAFGESNQGMEYPVTQEEIKVSLLFTNALCHPSVMFRKETMDYAYNENFSASQDYELWSRVIWDKQVRNIPMYLFNYRTHRNQTKHINSRMQKAGELQARTYMLCKLTSDFSAEEISVFQTMTCGIKTEIEMRAIEALLERIVDINRTRKVYDYNIMENRCAVEYFNSWYRSIGEKGVDKKMLKGSTFYYGYKVQPISKRLKTQIKLLYTFRGRLGGVTTG